MRSNLQRFGATRVPSAASRRSSTSASRYSTVTIISQAQLNGQDLKDSLRRKIKPPSLETKSYPIPGSMTTLYSYQLSKLPNIGASVSASSANSSTIMLEQSPAQKQIDALREIGEASRRQKTHVQMKPLDDAHELQMHSSDTPEVVKLSFLSLFPDRQKELASDKPLTIVTLAQKTKIDQRAWSEPMESEREQLCVHFIETASSIVEALRAEGYWADFIDPYSGRPYLGPFTNDALFEVDPRLRRARMGGFKIEDLGCCKVVSHPEWGTHAFIGTIFTDAPVDSPELIILEAQVNEPMSAERAESGDASDVAAQDDR